MFSVYVPIFNVFLFYLNFYNSAIFVRATAVFIAVCAVFTAPLHPRPRPLPRLLVYVGGCLRRLRACARARECV